MKERLEFFLKLTDGLHIHIKIYECYETSFAIHIWAALFYSSYRNLSAYVYYVACPVIALY